MYITVEMLREYGACSNQLDTFENEWPTGVEVTGETCLRAVELGLDVEWAAINLLPAPHWEAYQKATDSHWEAYEKATDSHWEAYLKSKAIEFAKICEGH